MNPLLGVLELRMFMRNTENPENPLDFTPVGGCTRACALPYIVW